MTHINGCFLVLKNFYDVNYVFFNLFDVLGIYICCNFSSQLHEEGNSMGAKERDGDPYMRVVFLEFYPL